MAKWRGGIRFIFKLQKYWTFDQQQIAEAHRDVDVLLFPIRVEGLPLVVIDAISTGLPVTTTNGPSLPKVVEDGITGLLCQQDGVISFKEAAEKGGSR